MNVSQGVDRQVQGAQASARLSYEAVCRPVASLNASERRQLASLYLRYYDGSDEARFYADLDGKSEVLLLCHEGGIVGFTTFLLYDFAWRGQRRRIVFSGDTIVAPAHWGQQTFTYAWAGRMGQLYRQAPALPLYWFLIVKGHRTYRYLPLIGQVFFPHWQQAPDGELQALAEALAVARFGDAYDPRSGLIRFERSHGHLRPEIAQPKARELEKASVAFFLRRNPGYLQGDELVCLCPLRADNMRPFARRVFLGGGGV
ncbi:MAG: hypothetical protein LBQ32_02625 [Burkholderiaceae bacterium]|nr:hypothetical protein [Burkholderiaceae bacterium]